MVMDSRALLDYAVFQLTPTRTRCDLVIFSGKKNEKIASGLLEPFVSHLKSAKDQISKGGYSITLRAPSEHCPWFTKATIERFVRFVSTPEVLERVVTIEREIDQIERSVESSEHGIFDGQGSVSVNGDPKIPVGHSKSKLDSCGSSGADAEENPKVRLQRILESRKAMLKKEQAMAYARSLVAGFEMDNLHELVSFSDAFGAIRLREACISFMELCNKKNDDKIWMDEVAAMQASYLGASGIMLGVENNDLSQTGLTKSSTSDSITRHGSLDTNEEMNLQQTEGTTQLPVWPHYLPQYMHNAQGPVYQQMPPYPGYVFPCMPGAPSHYPVNAPWPVNFQDLGMYAHRDIKNSQRYKSTRKKEKHANHDQPKNISNDESEEADMYTSGSGSSDEQEQEPSISSRERIHSKRLNRRSSKKVVIRNINYITSGRNEGSTSASDCDSSGKEDEYIDAGSLKQQVEDAVGSLKRHQKPSFHKSKVRDGNKKSSNNSNFDLEVENAGTTNSASEKKNGNWDIFQNLLMRDSESASADAGSKTMHLQEDYSIQNGHGEESLSFRKPGKPKYAGDDLILTERSTENGVENVDIKFEGEEKFHGVVKRGSKHEELLIPSRVEGEHYLKNAHLGTEPSITKTCNGEDWIIGSKLETSASLGENMDHNIFCGDKSSGNHFQGAENKRDVLLDDSFMIQSRLSDGPPQTQPKVDVLMVSDIVEANEGMSGIPGSSRGKVEVGNYSEPDDLYIMIGRDTAAEQVAASWRHEMDYGKDISLVETVVSQCNAKPDDKADRKGNKSSSRTGKEPGAKVDRKSPKPKAPSGYPGRSISDVSLRSKTLTSGSTMARSKSEKEEDKRKKMEELLKQRQKRIAERSSAKDVTSETSKWPSKQSKKNAVPTKTEKTQLRSLPDESKKLGKPVLRSSTIDRLAAPRTTSKQLPNESKIGQNRKPTPKANSVSATSSIKNTKGTLEKQVKDDLSDKKAGNTNNSKSGSSNIQKNNSVDTTPSVPEEPRVTEGAQGKNEVENLETVKVLHTVASVEKRETDLLSQKDAPEDENLISSGEDLLPSEDPPKQVEPHVNTNNVEITSQMTVHPGNNLKSPEANINEKGDEKRKISFSPQISVVDISTPPPENETNPELIHSRKKWNNGERSPKVPKGFRRLLLFGRRT